MAIQTLQDAGNSNLIEASYDGAIYRLASDDCVLYGIGDEFDLNYSSSSLDVTFDADSEASICGNFFKVKSTETLTLPASTTSYICARIDKSKADGSKGSFEALTLAQIEKGNINGSDNVRDLLLYIVQTNASGVIDVQDKRIIKSTSTSDVVVDTLSVGLTSLTITDARIKTNSILSIYTEIYGANPSSVSVNNGSVDLTFDVQATNMKVGIRIEGEY